MMATPDGGGPISSELQESIDEDVEDRYSNYSLEFDPEDSGRDHSSLGRDSSPDLRKIKPSGTELSTGSNHPKKSYLGDDRRRDAREAVANSDSNQQRLHAPRVSELVRQLRHTADRPASALVNGTGTESTLRSPADRVDSGSDERETRCALPVQFLKLKARLAGILEDIDGEPGLKRSAADALERISHEQQTLREGLAVVEQELVAARRNATQCAASRMRQMQEKRARAEARRVRHFEQLGEAKRVAVVAKAEAQAQRAQLAEALVECRHTTEMLEASRSSGSAAAELANASKKEAMLAKREAETLEKDLASLRVLLGEERTRANAAAREAADDLQLCERKRELEVSAATSAAEARERVAELRLSLLPEHQQQLLQAETERMLRWEERLTAEATRLQRTGETHKAEMEGFRAQMSRSEVELRARGEEDLSQARAELRAARSGLDSERGELLHRVAKAEAIGLAREAEAALIMAEATESKRRLEAETSALGMRAALLAPQFVALEEGKTWLEEARRQVREHSRCVAEETRRTLEMESSLREREAKVEAKWEEIANARRTTKQLERNLSQEAEVLSEQRRAVERARVRLLEQQMEVTLQMSEVRKALDLMRPVDGQGDRSCRRVALELGTLALARLQSLPQCQRHPGVSVAFDRGKSEEKMIQNVDKRPSVTPSPGEGELPRAAVEDAGGSTPKTYSRIGDLCNTRVRSEGVRGAYADEQEMREALGKIRAMIASGELGASGYAFGDQEELGGLLSVQAWAGRLQAAAIATGALPP